MCLPEDASAGAEPQRSSVAKPSSRTAIDRRD